MDQLKFTKTHEWLRLEGKNGFVGITQHAQEEISDVVYVELPKLGQVVRKEEEVAVVESVKAAFSIYAPLSGKVVQVNEALAQDPGAINRSPYGEGWIFALETSTPGEAAGLMGLQEYESWVKGQK